ncbi:uncharacterized protein LOC130735372 [Lotus japonicus]|uniref:uncharacterized protein LOC130735372 n=1 Tax=Lotus japonicus TaxID=34305 RepID=UPI002587104F|nr:uncharacterized protein LOC130735372 [Lotus japonicus]
MLQFPAFMTQYPMSTRTISTSFMLPSQWPQPHNEEFLLAMEESNFEEKCNEISNLIMIGKTTNENEKEEFDNEADDDDDADNAEASEGEEFEQETG